MNIIFTSKDVAPNNLDLGVYSTNPKDDTAVRACLGTKYTVKSKEYAEKINTVTKSVADEFIVPFWFVGTTDKVKDVNMVFKYKAITVMDHVVKVPYLENTVKIAGGAPLLFYSANPTKRTYPLIDSSDDSAASSEGKKPAAGKRQREA
jgi:hypothetical protein